MADVESILRTHNFKVTPTRIAVYHVLEKATHPLTAEDVFDQARLSRQISLATVYRTLAQFCDAGLTMKDTLLDGVTQYQLAASGHKHYLRCAHCNERIELDDCPLTAISREIAEKTGYVITGHSLEIVGICPSCQKEQA